MKQLERVEEKVDTYDCQNKICEILDPLRGCQLPLAQRLSCWGHRVSCNRVWLRFFSEVRPQSFKVKPKAKNAVFSYLLHEVDYKREADIEIYIRIRFEIVGGDSFEKHFCTSYDFCSSRCNKRDKRGNISITNQTRQSKEKTLIEANVYSIVHNRKDAMKLKKHISKSFFVNPFRMALCFTICLL